MMGVFGWWGCLNSIICDMLESDVLRADWEVARRHGLACVPGVAGAGGGEVCGCCMNRINKEAVALCENSKALEFLGYGFPLYFIFIKYALILLLMLIMTYTSVALYWSTRSSFCDQGEFHLLPDGSEGHCSSWMVRVARTELEVTEDEAILRATSFGVQLLVLLYMRDILLKTKQYYDEREISPSDFSILVEDLPRLKGVAAVVRRLLQDRQIFRRPSDLQAVVYISQLDRYFQLKDTHSHLIAKLQQLLAAPHPDTPPRIKLADQQILQVQRQIRDEELREKQAISNDQVDCEKLILILNTEAEKEQVIRDFQAAPPHLVQQYFGQAHPQFKEAPEPREILWQNINQPRSAFLKRLLISWSAYSLLLASVTVCFFYLLSLKTAAVEHGEGEGGGVKGSVLVWGSLLLVVVFNKFVLSTICEGLTSYEKQKTGGDYEFSFALKQVVGLFFTTAIMTLLVEDIRFHNIYSHEYGVIEEETIMFLLNGLVAPLIWLLNPWHIWRALRRRCYQHAPNFTQQQANQLMENPHYSIGKRYSEVIEGIWFTFLYASLIPVGSALTFLGLAIFYWIDKYNLLRKSSVLENVSSHISMQAMTLLDFTLVLRPLGELLFDSQIRTETSQGSLICFIVGMLYLVVPTNRLLDWIHPEDFELADQTYEQTKHLFAFNYETLHPLRTTFQAPHSTPILPTEQQELKESNSYQQRPFIDDEKDLNRPTHHSKDFQDEMEEQVNESGHPNLSGNGLIRGVKSLPPLRESRRKINLNLAA